MQTALKISGMQALRAVREDIQRTNALMAAEIERLRGPQVCMCVCVSMHRMSVSGKRLG